MNKRTVSNVVTKKFLDWVSSIDDKEVSDLVRDNTYITGGSIASLLLNEDVNDYDVYFRDKETALKVAEYYVKIFNNRVKSQIATVTEKEDGRIGVFIQSSGVAYEDEEEPTTIEEEEKPKYRPVFLSENAITLSDDMQLIIRFFGDIDEIHSNFDFVHATNYWYSEDRKLFLRQDALESLMTKELWYRGSKYPLASVVRTRKFIQRGWSIHAGTYLVMVMQLNELDLKNIEVLKDQLTGVDSAYFSVILDSIRDTNVEVSSSYIGSIVDKLYN